MSCSYLLFSAVFVLRVSFSIFFKPIDKRCSRYIETSQSICYANPLTGFYMTEIFVDIISIENQKLRFNLSWYLFIITSWIIFFHEVMQIIFIFSTKGPMIIWRFSTRVEISSRLNSKPLFKMTLQLHVKKTVFSQPEMKLHPGMKIPNFPYNRHFFQPGMKIWYYTLVNSLFIF